MKLRNVYHLPRSLFCLLFGETRISGGGAREGSRETKQNKTNKSHNGVVKIGLIIDDIHIIIIIISYKKKRIITKYPNLNICGGVYVWGEREGGKDILGSVGG